MIPLEWMPPLMFAGLFAVMLIGYPVAFTLAALGMLFGAIAIHEGYFAATFMQAIPQRVLGVLANDLLLAIPFFTFMGAVLEKCGLAEDMLDGMGQLFGPVRGGLGYSVILVGFILGMVTGTVAAQVIAMALISLPVMLRYGYHMRYATGVVAASGTITQLVPPSLVLIVLADQLGRPVRDLYAGAWGPSILQVLLFVLYTFLIARIRPHWLPAVPATHRTLQGWPLIRKCLAGIVPCAVLIFLVLGTLMLGLATPTEAGAMGAMGAVVLAVIRHPDLGWGRLAWRAGLIAGGLTVMIGMVAFKSLPFKLMLAVAYLCLAALLLRAAQVTPLRATIWQAGQSTMRLTAMVIFILIGSTCFTVVFQGVSGGAWLEHHLASLPGGVWGFLIAVNLFIFFIAFFLDFFEIAFILVPLLAPVAKAILTPVVGEDAALVWFGVMLCVNLQTSFMHPPFGFALFYLRGVAPKEVKTSDIYWGAVPFVAMQLMLVALVIAFPRQVTMFLDAPVKVDLEKVKIELESDRAPAGDGNEELMKALGAPPAAKDAPKAPAPAKKKTKEEEEQDELMRALGAK